MHQSELQELGGRDGIELSSLSWLQLHHRVKLPDRRALIGELDIRPGDRVLDLGCGPGLWTPLIADAVGDSGTVLGLDFDQAAIAHARQAACERSQGVAVEFDLCSFDDLDNRYGTFDVIFISNSFCYSEHPAELLHRAVSITNAGGRVIGRNWDGGVFLLHPLPEILQAKVQCGIVEHFSSTKGGSYFDNYFGRKMPGLFQSIGFEEVSCYTQVIERTAPVDHDLADYIRINGHWMGSIAGDFLSPTELDEWTSYFDPDDAKFVANSPEFYFSMMELSVTGHVER